ncbi:MAG: DUF429 domain-containing protein [Comamonadaceae bacterium]|nr:MAG: DUF429 domain-containing protein [Comamonadaceae bacterium]
MLLFGCDFSSSPSRRKPIVVATGSRVGRRVLIHDILSFPAMRNWADWLIGNDAWVGGFDFPFGLPRELVQHLGWPLDWRGCMDHYIALSRSEIRSTFMAFCAARPVGGKFAHRATDVPAGSSTSMKWVNPPVAYMLHAGMPALLNAEATLPGLQEGRADRIALEAYPGLLARELIGRRSYKSDSKAGSTSERLTARECLLDKLEQGNTRLGLCLEAGPVLRASLVADASADRLDAVLCLVQTVWAYERRHSGWGLPKSVDPLEGWIVSA